MGEDRLLAAIQKITNAEREAKRTISVSCDRCRFSIDIFVTEHELYKEECPYCGKKYTWSAAEFLKVFKS